MEKHTPHYWVCLRGALRGMLEGVRFGGIQRSMIGTDYRARARGKFIL